MVPFLLFAFTAATVINKVASKTCSNIVAAKSNRIKYLIYLTLVGIIACGVLFTINGFKISFTLQTLYYSIAFSVVCTLSVICHLEIFKLANISGALVLSSFGSLIATSAVGFFLFDEELSVRTLLKIGLMLIPAVLTFIDATRSKERKVRSASVRLIVIIILLVVAGCGSTVVIKLYGRDSGVTDMSSMFFFTNVIQAFCALLLLGFFIFKNMHEADTQTQTKEAINIFRPLPILAITANTAASNITSLLSAALIESMDISIYTPISSALVIIAGVIASFIYRERHGLFFYLSAVFALIAVII